MRLAHAPQVMPPTIRSVRLAAASGAGTFAGPVVVTGLVRRRSPGLPVVAVAVLRGGRVR